MCFLGVLAPSYRHLPHGKKRRDVVVKHYYSAAFAPDRLWFYNNISDVFFHVKDDVYIIDNLNNRLLKFDKNGNVKSTITIHCNTTTNNNVCQLLEEEGGRIWKNNIIIDTYDTSNVYMMWKDGIKSKLFVLNLLTGLLKFIKTLPHLFPTKIMIYNKKIYYLYKKPGNLRDSGLYRTEL